MQNNISEYLILVTMSLNLRHLLSSIENHSTVAISDNGENIYLPHSSASLNRICDTYDIFETRSGFKTNIKPIHIKHTDFLFASGYFLVGVDINKSLIYVYSKKSDKPVSVISPGTNRSTKLVSLCINKNQQIPIFFFTTQNSSKLYAINLTNNEYIRIKYVVPQNNEQLDKKLSSGTVIISNLTCHPTKSLLFITFSSVTSMSTFSLTTVYNYDHLKNKFRLNLSINEDNNEESTINNDIESLESASVSGATSSANTTSRSIFKRTSSFIQPSSSSSSLSFDIIFKCNLMRQYEQQGRLREISFDKLGTLTAMLWEDNSVTVYDTRFIVATTTTTTNATIPINTIELKSIAFRKFDETILNICFHSKEPLLTVINSNNQLMLLTLLEPLLHSIEIINLNQYFKLYNNNYSIKTIQCSNLSGLFIITMNQLFSQQNNISIAVFSFNELYLTQLSYFQSIASKVSVPPDCFIDGNDAMKWDDFRELENDVTVGQTIGQTAKNKAKIWPLILILRNNLEISTNSGTKHIHLSVCLYICLSICL